MPESQQPSRRGRARGKASERVSRQRATRAAKEAAQALDLAREELLGRGLLARAPFAGLDAGPEVAEEAVAVRPLAVVSPVPAPVDRRDLLAIMYIDTKVIDKEGKLRAILRREYGYPSGGLPGDPGRFYSGVDPRVAVCHVLSPPAAAARCLVGGRYLR